MRTFLRARYEIAGWLESKGEMAPANLGQLHFFWVFLFFPIYELDHVNM